MNKLRVKSYLMVFSLLAIAGCADLNTTAFRVEKTSADLSASSVSSFNRYYEMSTNGASAAKIADLTKQRDQIWDASRKLSAVLAITEASRLAFSTNASPANKALLESSLSALSANSGSITGIVADAMAPYSTLK